MTLATLRNDVRDLLSEDTGNLPNSTLDTLIERARQRAEGDFLDDYGSVPRQMITSVSGTITSDGYPLPTDYRRMKTVKIGDAILRYMPLEVMPTQSQREDSTVNFVYYASIPKLSADTDTNWLLDAADRVYIYGTALEYALWNDEVAEYRGKYAELYTEAVEKTSRANSPRPSGGWGRQRSHQLGSYSINATHIIFGPTF